MNNYAEKKLLKFMTCGSVDDGKSTLIGHLLYDAKLLYEDQIKNLKNESRIVIDSEDLDYSLLLDGLMAEHEQRITIDVAYRFFCTKQRHFIVADEVTIFPGGEYANISQIYVTDQHVTKAVKGQAVTISLKQERDVSRGFVISNGAGYLRMTKLFRATLLWMDEKELIQGREFLLKLGNKMIPAVVINLKCNP